MLTKLLQSRLILASMARQRHADHKIVRYEASHDAMGTTFALVAYGPDREQLAAVVNEVFEEIDRLHDQMNCYRSESEICHINRNAARQSVVVEPRLFRLIQDSIHHSEETGGAFDITAGPLLKSWGFFRGRGRVPGEAEIAGVLKTIGYRHVKLDAAARALRFDQDGVELDLGGIAKGYAVDRAVEILRFNGVTSALVSSGTSSIYALSAPPQNRAWTITLRDPFHADKGADVILLKNCSLSASGNYVRSFELNGKTYSHIMDPAAGRPAEGMLSTTVLALETTESEALSTAFYVMGLKRGSKYLAAHPNLMVVYYQPGSSRGAFERIVARSTFYTLPADVVAEIVTERKRIRPRDIDVAAMSSSPLI